MISFLDAAMVPYIAGRMARFPNMPIVYAPPDVAREQIAAFYQKKDQVNQVAPGISVFRTAAPLKEDSQSYALSSYGWPQGRDANGNYVDAQAICVECEYTVTCIARSQLELNDMERELTFLEVYNPVTFDLAVRSVDNPEQLITCAMKRPVVGGNPMYSRVPDAKTGKSLWYQLTKQFYVTGWWLDTSLSPQILGIDVTYILSGEPIDVQEIREIRPLES